MLIDLYGYNIGLFLQRHFIMLYSSIAIPSRKELPFHTLLSHRFLHSLNVFLQLQGLEIGDHLLIVSALSILTIWLPLFYMLCNFGESVTNISGSLDQCVYSQSWYMCPKETQRYFILLLMMTHRPLYINGFASLHCSRETFKNVTSHFVSLLDSNKSGSFRRIHIGSFQFVQFPLLFQVMNAGYSYFMILRRFG